MMSNDPHGRRFMSEINVVPLVDVVLVLLVIFMITAPLLYRGIDIDLPRTAANNIVPTERVILTVARGGIVFVNEKKIPLERLGPTLSAMKGRSSEMTVYLRGDRNVPYGTVVQVMDVVKRVGIDKLGMVTEPAPDRK